MMDSITNCTADVTIESAKGGHAIGGLCGYAGTHSNPDVCLETEGFSTKNYPSVIDNCHVNVSISAPGATHVGGLVGTGLYYYGEETIFKITNCSEPMGTEFLTQTPSLLVFSKRNGEIQ